ncbi:MAG: AGE family epimerase/isomerase [Roseburia sp.]|nr:AGE family epimerase/isomerase [Roseburia sp.]
MMKDEIRSHLTDTLIPFWKGLRDEENGGYYGYVGYDLAVDKQAVKGCILNSRILWFFSNAYRELKETALLEEAGHAYAFLKDFCVDKENGGVYWSMTCDGKPEDTTKHTYNQAFSIYALSSYYDASKDQEALALAMELFSLIEEKCTDGQGYLEAFTREFAPESNEKLSENGVLAEKTMNTLLHVFEAYTELYRVSHNEAVRARLVWMLDVFAKKVYNPKLERLEVFFDKDYHSLIDLHSYGHDIETAWLIDRGLSVLDDADCTKKLSPVTRALAKRIYETAFDGRSLANECERGVVNERRIWWVQAEAIVGFLNAYEHMPEHREYLQAAESVWQFTRDYVIDKRPGGEWFWYVDQEGVPAAEPIVGPWKCPYHNGRMCLEVLRRL